jgi:hypothetical protein
MTYPGAVTTFTAKTDNVDDVMAVDINELQTDVTAVETTLGTDPQGTETDVKSRLAHSINDAGFLEFDAPTELTISSGAVTVTQNYHTIDTESDAASDNLSTINGGTDGMVLVFRAANDARTVVIKHDDGNIYCNTGADISLDTLYKWAWGVYDDGLSMWFIR